MAPPKNEVFQMIRDLTPKCHLYYHLSSPNSPDSLASMKILGPVITTDTIAKINLALYIESWMDIEETDRN